MSPQPEHQLLEAEGGEHHSHEHQSIGLEPPLKVASQQSSGLTSPRSEQQVPDTEISQKSSRSSLQAEEPLPATPAIQGLSISSTDQAEPEPGTSQQPSTSFPPPQSEKLTTEQRSPQPVAQPEFSIDSTRYTTALDWAIKYPGFPFFSTGDPSTDRALHFHRWHSLVVRAVRLSVEEGKKAIEEPKEKARGYEKELKKVETELKWHKHRLGVKVRQNPPYHTVSKSLAVFRFPVYGTHTEMRDELTKFLFSTGAGMPDSSEPRVQSPVLVRQPGNR